MLLLSNGNFASQSCLDSGYPGSGSDLVTLQSCRSVGFRVEGLG